MASQIIPQTRAVQSKSLAKVICGAATGTLIEWYDFYIFGSLTSVLAVKFYPPGNDTFALIAYLATFAMGFLIRPFGALFFGCVGDLVGRRIAFIATLGIMGTATASIGLLPTFQTAGWFSPIALIAIRLLQGLAIGGEYGGAAVYVAEHVPDRSRGFYTSFLQMTAGLGLVLSLGVILATEQSMTSASFQQWGWRLPFLLSIVLVGISLYIRFRMKESPIFSHIKSSGTQCTTPIRDAFGKWGNLKQVLISLFGAAAGQSVVSYTGMFFALFYLQNIVRVNAHTSNVIVAVAIIAAQPLYPVVGALSDRIGRKKIMMAGMLLFVVSVFPMYKAMQQAAGNNVVTVSSTKDRVTGDIHLTPLSARSLQRQTHSRARGASSQPTGAHFSCLAPDRLLDHDVRSHCGVPCGSFPGKNPLHLRLSALSHREWSVRGPAAVDRRKPVRLHRQYLCRSGVPGRGFRTLLCGGHHFPEGEPRHTDLGGTID